MPRPQSLEAFLQSLSSGLDRGSPVTWASAVLIGEVKGIELHAYDTSGEIEIGARVVGVSDDSVAPKTLIMAQLDGEAGGAGHKRTTPHAIEVFKSICCSGGVRTSGSRHPI